MPTHKSESMILAAHVTGVCQAITDAGHSEEDTWMCGIFFDFLVVREDFRSC